jgi:hypothetical protein
MAIGVPCTLGVACWATTWSIDTTRVSATSTSEINDRIESPFPVTNRDRRPRPAQIVIEE